VAQGEGPEFKRQYSKMNKQIFTIQKFSFLNAGEKDGYFSSKFKMSNLVQGGCSSVA
jgi:hypothetical protein